MRHLFRLANLTEVHLVQLGGWKADSYCYQRTSYNMEKLWWPWLEPADGMVGGRTGTFWERWERLVLSTFESHLELCCLEILNSVSKNRAISQPLTWDTWVRCRQNLFSTCPGHIIQHILSCFGHHRERTNFYLTWMFSIMLINKCGGFPGYLMSSSLLWHRHFALRSFPIRNTTHGSAVQVELSQVTPNS